MIWLWTTLGIIVGLGAIVALVWMIGMALGFEGELPRAVRRRYAVGAFALAVALLTVIVAGAIQSDQAEKDQGPCLHESTGQRYDPATKTVRSYTFCDERGTWKK